MDELNLDKIMYIKRRDLFTLIFFYIGLCLILFLVQSSLLYFPDKSTSYNQQHWQKIIVDEEVLGLESKMTSENVIVLFHGNAGNANNRIFYQKLFPKNTHLIVAEYPGYGLNKDKKISKENIIKHARKVIEYAKNKYGNKVTIAGESLGTGVASQMAQDFNINKLLLITPYSSIEDVAQDKFWFIPVFLLLKDNYDNIDILKNYNGNTLVLIAEKDQVIPAKYGYKLYNAISSQIANPM